MNNFFYFKHQKYRTSLCLFGIKIRFKNKFDINNIDIDEYLKMYDGKFINKSDYIEKMKSFNNWGLNTKKRKVKIVVSLTSFNERLYELPFCLYSLLNQNFKPDRVILWLSETEFPNRENDLPEEILKFKNNGLTIEFCPDIRSYKKLIYSLKKYPNDIIVTSDDDCFYEENWLKNLYNSYLKYPNSISAYSVKKIIKIFNYILPYNLWLKQKNSDINSFRNFLIGEAGVLYPPGCFDKNIFDESMFQKISPYNDDLWFWACAVYNGTKIVKVNSDNSKIYKYINMARELGLSNQMSLFRNYNKNKANEQIKNVISYLKIGKYL